QAGCVFYDVGAHIGLFSLIASRLVGSTGAVFAFEPDVENVGILQQHIDRNAASNVRTVQSAVWSASGDVEFRPAVRASSRNTGAVATDRDSAAGRVMVPAVALDDFAIDHPAPHLIKIDVEGGEVDVLRGAERLL